jgi:endoglucanase
MRMVLVRLGAATCTLMVALAATVNAQNRAADAQTASVRAQHLRRGINASEWFSQARDYSAARTDRYTDDSDIALIAKLGFDHVRLSIDADALDDSFRGAGAAPDFVARLDRVVDTMLRDRLAVIIDLQPTDDFKHQLKNDEGVERFLGIWKQLAQHFARRDSERVFFEILNEPEVEDASRWAMIQARAVQTIREVAPRTTIIATGSMWSDIVDLLATQPLSDNNVIYNFHFYQPHEFTHQGAGWGVSWWGSLHGIGYPMTGDPAPQLLQELPNPVDRYQLENVLLNHWDGHRIRLLMDEAASWGRTNHVPLICDEFGVYREHADVQSRVNWLHDVRVALEADGIGWAMWDYRGGFGVVVKENGQPAKVDEAVVKALGLQ